MEPWLTSRERRGLQRLSDFADHPLTRAAGLWLIALAVAALLDYPVAIYLQSSGFAGWFKGSVVARVLKLPGEFPLLAVVAVALCLLHRLRWRAGVFLLLAAVVAAVNALFKWVVGRTRPFRLPELADEPNPFYLKPFRGGLPGLFEQSNLSFPSGHASLAFATAAALAILIPRWRWAFFAVAALTSLERVAENAHYVSDAVGAAALGVVGVWLVHRMVRPWMGELPPAAAANGAQAG